MGIEFEAEVHILEDFGSWTDEEKKILMTTILEGRTWEFIGQDTIEYEPPGAF